MPPTPPGDALPRCAGSAAAATLARAGRRVIAVDPARFPATTVSTHLLFAGGVAEPARVGALERVEKIGAPRLSRAFIGGPGHASDGSYTPIDGVDYGLCVRRAALDQALAENAREAGAEIRHGHRVTGILWQDGRAVGVRVQDGHGHGHRHGGAEYEIRARLVVGVDGRRSTVARLVGADRPRIAHANGRACYYAYYEDPHRDWRSTAAMWLTGRELGNAFPCDGGLTLVLLMPPVDRAADFRGSLEAEFGRTEGLIPGLAARLAGLHPQHEDRQLRRAPVVLPPLGRSRLGSDRRRGTLQGPRHGAGDPRRRALRHGAGARPAIVRAAASTLLELAGHRAEARRLLDVEAAPRT
ncbi:hypothetical protein GCM10022419_083700 [Nonomuraea rosea]|uniref:FAD-binding domain-containing protein n=1 Tax=Nonomuraea rosea TaxID=638574 RepID=A0ABP6YQD0_9ACTN